MVGQENKEKEITMSQPAHKIRIGNLSVTIWRNVSDKGTWYSVTPSRSFKLGDETWKETDSFGFDDLLAMAKLMAGRTADARKDADYFLVLPWSFKTEFLEREAAFRARGGKFIFPLPDLEVV